MSGSLRRYYRTRFIWIKLSSDLPKTSMNTCRLSHRSLADVRGKTVRDAMESSVSINQSSPNESASCSNHVFLNSYVTRSFPSFTI